MKRVVYVKLDGKEYPLCCSLGALEEFQQNFGSIQAFHDKTIQDRDLRTYITALEILMKYGAARVKRYEDKEVELMPHEDIMEVLNLDDLTAIETAVWEAISKSQKNEVAGKPGKDTKKKEA